MVRISLLRIKHVRRQCSMKALLIHHLHDVLQVSTVPKASSSSSTVDPRKRKHEAASTSSSASSTSAPANTSVDPVLGTASTVDLGGAVTVGEETGFIVKIACQCNVMRTSC